jgi:ABC-type glycerol-3-phosphate transport system substrate-binding protein
LSLFAACSPPAVQLWTDVSELAPVVETYNASQNERVVELVFEPNIQTELRLAAQPPDIVISSFIEDARSSSLFQPLDGMLNRRLNRAAFYVDLLASGRRNNRQLFLPVAFHLPLIYYAQPIARSGTSPIITSEEMIARAETFNRGTGSRWTHVAYSPLWNPEFLYHFVRAKGVDFVEAETGQPTWDDESLDVALETAGEWIVESNGSLALDREFVDRYLYAPELQLVRQGRIAYGFSTSESFFSISDARRSGLQFRWLGEDGTIPVLENVLYAGVPQGAGNVPGAHDFLTFLFNNENQILLLEDALGKEIDTFGLAGGFSSLWEITERHMDRFYPELSGRIPSDEMLAFPPPSPRHWGSLKQEVVIPRLRAEVNERRRSRSLRDQIDAWLLQQEE